MTTETPTSITHDSGARRAELLVEIDLVIRRCCPEIGDGAYDLAKMTAPGQTEYLRLKREIGTLAGRS